MFVRVLMICRRRVVQRDRGVNEKLRLPLWAFPLMWTLTFVVLVSVSSVQGTKDPVTRTIEVSTVLLLSYDIIVHASCCFIKNYPAEHGLDVKRVGVRVL